MTKLAETQQQKKNDVDGVAIVGGLSAGAASAWGAVEFAKGYVESNYEKLRSTYINNRNEWLTERNTHNTADYASEEAKQLAQQAIEKLKETTDESQNLLIKVKKTIGAQEKLIIGTVVCAAVALVVGGAIHWLNNRETPTPTVATDTVELAEQKLVQESPEQAQQGAAKQ